jgi:hypothetical protein
MKTFGWFACCVIALACARATNDFPLDAEVRPPAGAPSRFIFDVGALSMDSVHQMKCRTPLWDLRDSTKLELVRSHEGKKLGDYSVTPERYRVGPQDLLRLSCENGTIIGVVPR